VYNGSSNWFDIDTNLNRHAEFLREAEYVRLVKSIQVSRKQRTTLTAAILSWLGVRLVCWGARLQERAGHPSQVDLNKLFC
jgi:hypothetical protein